MGIADKCDAFDVNDYLCDKICNELDIFYKEATPKEIKRYKRIAKSIESKYDPFMINMLSFSYSPSSKLYSYVFYVDIKGTVFHVNKNLVLNLIPYRVKKDNEDIWLSRYEPRFTSINPRIIPKSENSFQIIVDYEISDDQTDRDEETYIAGKKITSREDAAIRCEQIILTEAGKYALNLR